MRASDFGAASGLVATLLASGVFAALDAVGLADALGLVSGVLGVQLPSNPPNKAIVPRDVTTKLVFRISDFKS